MKTFKVLTITDSKHAFKRLEEINEALKEAFNVQYVANYDILALCSNFERQGLRFYDFETIDSGEKINGYKPNIRESEGVKVLCIGFKEIAKYIDCSFSCVLGSNCNNPAYEENGTFYNDDLKMILPHSEQDAKNMSEQVKNHNEGQKAWKHFENEVKPKMSSGRLGERFEVGNAIYWHFLECLPPIYGKGCFYCSEPHSHTNEGEAVYYKLMKTGEKYYIEFNTVS